MEKNNNKKWYIVIIIVLIIIITAAILLIIFNSKKEKEMELSEFEKISVYNYIENYLIDYNLLSDLNKEENMVVEDERKLCIAIEDYCQRNNTMNISIENVGDNYERLFGEETNLNIEAIELYNSNYIYNPQNDSIEIKQKIEEKETNEYKVTKVSKNNDEYIVNLDIYNAIDGEGKENLDNELTKQKIGYSVLKLKILDGRYVIANYSEEINI